MSELGRQFMSACLGEEGSAALRKAAEREPQLDQILVPRAILGWLSFVAEHEYEGEIPGVENTWVQFSKAEGAYSGSISLNKGIYSFEKASVYHLAASIAMALGVQAQPIEANVRDTVLVRLGKSIDTLAKAQVLMAELKKPEALQPQRVLTHGAYHIEQALTKSDKPYSVIHSATNAVVQQEIATLKDAGEVAAWHQNKYRGHFKPLNKRQLDQNQGIRFTHEHHDLGDGEALTHVKAIHPTGKVVGEAMFEHKPGVNTLRPADVTVHPEHRRKGIASAMYQHAEKVTNKQIAPSTAQTPMGQALWAGNAQNKQFGKVELPGQSQKPQTQQGPQAPTPPAKQPAASAKAKKQPSLQIGKSEAERECEACGGHQFKDNKFHGCVCFRDLSKSIKTTAYGDGYVLEFGLGIDQEAVKTLMKTFRSGQ